MNSRQGEGAAARELHRVTISRDYDFPRKAVFDMFTDEKKAAKFWGPKGAVKLAFEFDPRPGGAVRIQDLFEGRTATTTGKVVEIVPPELIVFTSATRLEDAAAPWEALQRVQFEALGPVRTRVTIIVSVLATGAFPGSPEDLGEGFQGGWGETLDMLRRDLR